MDAKKNNVENSSFSQKKKKKKTRRKLYIYYKSVSLNILLCNIYGKFRKKNIYVFKNSINKFTQP